jgi:hypothetical protein
MPAPNLEEKRGSVLANLEILQKIRNAVDYFGMVSSTLFSSNNGQLEE